MYYSIQFMLDAESGDNHTDKDYENYSYVFARAASEPDDINGGIIEATLNLKENEINDCTLTIVQTSPMFSKLKPFKSHISIYEEFSRKEVFRGRLLKQARKMTSSGEILETLTFESTLSYLLDTVQQFEEVHNTSPADYFKKLIDYHNEGVPKYKQFTVGKVDVTNSTDNVYRYTEYDNTWKTIQDKLVSRLGGYIVDRWENGYHYIDYLKDPGVDHKDKTIELGYNLRSSSVDIDTTKIITRFVPLGSTIQEENDTDIDNVAHPRTTIVSVNNNQYWIDIPELQKEFGVIEGTNIWEDVHDPKILLTKAKEWILKQTISTDTWDIESLEIDEDHMFNVSDRYQFINEYVATPQLLRITEKHINLLEPSKTTLKIGDKERNLVDYQLESLGLRKQTEVLQTQQNQAKRAINSLKTIIENLEKENEQLRHDALVGAGSGTDDGGPTTAVNGDWGPAIKHAAALMNVKIDDNGVNLVKAQIRLESGGNDKAVGGTDGLADGRASGLLQFKPGTFNYYALEGHKDIWKGFDQLLAAFNIPNFLGQISGQSGWSPHGAPRYKKVPVAEASGGVAKLQKEARKYKGVPYVWGGGRPVGVADPYKGMDCSSYVARVYYDMGIKNIPAQTVAMEPYFHTVSKAQPGDVGFYGGHGSSYHVCLFLDEKTIIFEPQPGQSCKETSVNYFPPSWIARNDQMSKLITGN